MAVEDVRRSEGIREFLDGCRCIGLSMAAAFRHYITGLDSRGNKIDIMDHLSRGASLLKLTDAWLDVWEQRD